MKNADVEYPVHELIASRWSPYAFSERALDEQTVGSLLEAARWAPSCFNAQPWRFLMAQKSSDPEGFERLASTIVEGNAWANDTPMLILSVAELHFARNGKPNRHAQHDVGLAVENLVLQAQSMGLVVHQMGGFMADKAIEVLSIPEGFEPMAMIAVGYPGDSSKLNDDLRGREESPRQRQALSEIVFGAGWEQAAQLG